MWWGSFRCKCDMKLVRNNRHMFGHDLCFRNLTLVHRVHTIWPLLRPWLYYVDINLGIIILPKSTTGAHNIQSGPWFVGIECVFCFDVYLFIYFFGAFLSWFVKFSPTLIVATHCIKLIISLAVVSCFVHQLLVSVIYHILSKYTTL